MFRCIMPCKIYMYEEGLFNISKNQEFNISNAEIIFASSSNQKKEFFFYGDSIHFSLINVLIKYKYLYIFKR